MGSPVVSIGLRGRPGCYAFWAGAQALYVGASVDLWRRPKQSGLERDLRERGAVHLVLAGCDRADVLALEAFLIASLRPELNRQGRLAAVGACPPVFWVSAPVLVAGQGASACDGVLPGLVGPAVPVLPVRPEAVQGLALITRDERKGAALEADRAAFREHERDWNERTAAMIARREAARRPPVLPKAAPVRFWWSDD